MMNEFVCKYCGSIDLRIEEKGTQTGMYCNDCDKWLKWLNKNEKIHFQTLEIEKSENGDISGTQTKSYTKKELIDLLNSNYIDDDFNKIAVITTVLIRNNMVKSYTQSITFSKILND